MKTLLHPVALLTFVLVIGNQALERSGIFIPFLHSYLDDFLCFPLILSVGLSMYRTFWPNYKLGPLHIWPLFVVIVVYFEFYLPKQSDMYTADPIDIIAYLAGIIWFLATVNRAPQDRFK